MSRAFRYARDKATDYSNPHHSSAHLPVARSSARVYRPRSHHRVSRSFDRFPA